MATRILYVDDEEDLRMLVQCQLSLTGYQVELVPDGPAALERLEREQFDLVLLDLHMPGMSGAEVITRLRQRNLSPTLLLLTGDSPADAGTQCQALGAAGFLTKPFHFRDLAAAIEQVLAHTGADGGPAAA